MADLVATTRTTLSVEEVIVQAVQFFTTEKWRAQTQSTRIVTFMGRPPIPVGKIILFILLIPTIIGAVIMYFLVVRQVIRFQNLTVTASPITGGTEVSVTYPKHAKKMVDRFIDFLPKSGVVSLSEPKPIPPTPPPPMVEPEPTPVELHPAPVEIKSSAPEPVPPPIEIEPSSEPLHAPAPTVPKAMAKLLVTQTGRVGQEFAITKDSMNIGRWDADSGAFPEIDLSQDDPGSHVSRRHAHIFFTDGKYFIEDVGSTNGTFVNKKRLDPGMPHELKYGDEVILGRTFLKFLT